MPRLRRIALTLGDNRNAVVRVIDLGGGLRCDSDSERRTWLIVSALESVHLPFLTIIVFKFIDAITAE